MDNRTRGSLSESAVISFMQGKGYRLLVRNFTVHNIGELDAVMVKGDTVAVIEVKSRKAGASSADGFSPGEAVTRSKVRKIRNTVNILVSTYSLWDKDIVLLAGLVTHTSDGRITDIEVVPIEL